MQFIDKMGEGGGGQCIRCCIPFRMKHNIELFSRVCGAVILTFIEKINHNLFSSIYHFLGNK